jgi:protein required for attachment to host cells
MATTWIIAADSSRARILQVTDREGHLAEIEDFVNPQARLHERDLATAAEPRFNGQGGGGPGSDREAKSKADHEVEVFVRQLAEYLDKARTGHRYDRLHVIAPPKFLGQLRKTLGKEVAKLVAEELPKDLSWLNTRQIEQSLAGRLR